MFGAVHFIYLWEGDILFSYAVGALALLIVLYGRARPILIGCAVLVGLGFIPDADLFFRVAGGLAACGLLALYLRGEKHLAWRGASVPLFSVLLMLAGALVSIAACVFWLLPDGPIEPRVPLTVFGPLLLVTGWLSWKYHEPADRRSLRMAVSIYVFAGVAMTAMSLVQHVTPDPLRRARAGRRASRPRAPRQGIVGRARRADEEAEEDAARARGRVEGRAREEDQRSMPPTRPRRPGSSRPAASSTRSSCARAEFPRRRPATPASRSSWSSMFLLGTGSCAPV